jgi:hypothetical protein
VVAFDQSRIANAAKVEAERQTKQPQAESDKAHIQLLAMQAHREATDVTSADAIERAGALALASIAKSTDPPEADAIEAARSAFSLLPLRVLSHGGGRVTSLVVLRDGRLASGGEDGKIELWPKEEGAGEPVVLLQASPIWSLAVLADGRLASAGDRTIALWPKEGIGTLVHGGRVVSLAVLADGRLASSGEGGQIKLWLVDEKKLIAALCLRAGRNLSKAEWARYIGADTPWQPNCRTFGVPSNWRTVDETKSGLRAADGQTAR